MEIESFDTTILNIGRSTYVRIPPELVDYFHLKGGMKAKISDKSNREASIVFPE